jgi:hypothetical protein
LTGGSCESIARMAVRCSPISVVIALLKGGRNLRDRFQLES